MSPWWWWLWSWWWLWWWYRLVQHSLELSTRWWYRLVHLQHSLELSTRWQCWCWYDHIDLEITNDDSVTKVLIFIMFIEWSAVQATSFVPFPRMQCILVQVNSHAATSVWVRDVRHWILALPRCAISWILFAGVWVWHTQNFFGEPILPLCRAFLCKCFHATTSVYEHVSVWRQMMYFCSALCPISFNVILFAGVWVCLIAEHLLMHSPLCCCCCYLPEQSLSSPELSILAL